MRDPGPVITRLPTQWLAALYWAISDDYVLAVRDVLLPNASIDELASVCDTLLSGRGGPFGDDRASLSRDFLAMRRSLGPALTKRLSPLLNEITADVNPKRLSTPQGARAISLTLDEFRGRLNSESAAQAAWDDVVAGFMDRSLSCADLENRLAILRDISEARGHTWGSSLGTLSRQLAGLLFDNQAAAEEAGLIEEADLDAPFEPAGLQETVRLDACRAAIGERAKSGDVAVWLLFKHAYVESWMALGPVQLFHAALVPEANLDGIEGYRRPPELEGQTADEARLYLGKLDIGPDDHAVLARVWLTNTSLMRAADKARDLVETLMELAADGSQWRLQEGAACYTESIGWFGTVGFMDPVQLQANRRAHPFHEPTRKRLSQLEPAFADRLAANDPLAVEAVEDARWVVSVAASSTSAQRVALGTRALERILGIAQISDEHWTDVAERYLRAPWVRLEVERWAQAATWFAADGLLKTHGYGETQKAVHDSLWPTTEVHGTRDWDVERLRSIEDDFAPLDQLISPNLLEYRLVRDALGVLNQSTAADALLNLQEQRFATLLSRVKRSRNSVIHGQRPAASTLASVEGFTRDLGRLAAQDSMFSAETGALPLSQLEGWRIAHMEARSALQAGAEPLPILFGHRLTASPRSEP